MFIRFIIDQTIFHLPCSFFLLFYYFVEETIFLRKKINNFSEVIRNNFIEETIFISKKKI